MFSILKQLGLKKRTFLLGIPKFFKNFVVGISIPFDRAHGSSRIFGLNECVNGLHFVNSPIFGKLLPGHFHAICPLAESTRRLIFIELEASYIFAKIYT